MCQKCDRFQAFLGTFPRYLEATAKAAAEALQRGDGRRFRQEYPVEVHHVLVLSCYLTNGYKKLSTNCGNVNINECS